MASAFFVLGVLRRDVSLKQHAVMLLLIGVLIVYTLIVKMATGSPDWTGVWISWKLLLYYTAASWFIAFWRSIYKERAYIELVKCVILCSALNALVVYAAFLSSTFRGGIARLIFIDESNISWVFDGRRAFDISMGGGASASFVFSVVFVLGLVHWNSLSAKQRFATLFVGGSTFLLGRSGVLFVIGAVVVAAIMEIVKRTRQGKGGGARDGSSAPCRQSAF
ncbi:hypothetical protein [Thermomonas brevis]